MLGPYELAQFADACITIGDEVSDERGFVPVRSLLARFQASLIIRPLLVEGMLASIEQVDGNGFNGRWAVLVDSETYNIDESDIVSESEERPLPSRLRNTIAHELVHSLAFRPSEFGVRLRNPIGNKESQTELVEAIERETEKLSPLLLWSEKAIVRLLRDKKSPLSLDELRNECRRRGISREVLINRLRLLGAKDDKALKYREGLSNLAIGMAEWIDDKSAVLRSWPLFFNFDRNHIPAFLLNFDHQDRLSAKAVFKDSAFAMCGGHQPTLEFVTDAGIASVPNAERMRVECSSEVGSRKPGSRFLYVVRKLDTNQSATH